MKNTKFRRRALLSSVAMLLVALVALGSATFAWFTTNPDANTNSLNLKATSSIGLVIQSQTEKGIDSTKWSHDAILHAKATSATDNTPIADTTAVAIGAASQDASTGTSKGIYQIPAAADDEYYADTTETVATSTGGTTGGNHYEEKIYMKVTGGSESNVYLKKVTINNVADTGLARALRVAILNEDGKVLGIFKPTGTTTDNEYLTGTGAYASKLSSTAYSATASGTGVNVNVGKNNSGTPAKISTSGDDYITVRVYLDGEDAEVYSQNISTVDLASVMNGLVIELKADT